MCRKYIMILKWDLALINQAAGLYGRILIEVVSTDQTQWGLYSQTKANKTNLIRLM